MYERKADVPARIGVVIYDPHDDEFAPLRGEKVSLWRHASAIVPDSLIAKFKPRKQYIGQLEVLAAVCAPISRPDQYRGREVIAFIDNTGAVFGLAKGYMRDVDSARMVHSFHCVCAALNTQVWIEYIPSAANISDLPSRNEFALLHELGSTSFEVRWPEIGSGWSGVFERIFDEFANKPTKSEKRARTSVRKAIEIEREAKRAR